MALKPNYTPAALSSLLNGQPQPIAARIPGAFPLTATAQPTRAISNTPGGTPTDPILDDQYGTALGKLSTQQQQELADWISQNEHVSEQLDLQKKIDDLQSKIAGYPAEREKAYQAYLNGLAYGGNNVPNSTAPAGVPVASGINADGTPHYRYDTGVIAGSQQFVEPGDPTGWQTQLEVLQKRLQDIQTAFNTGKIALTEKQKAYYKKVSDTVTALKAHDAKQKQIDEENQKKIDAYKALVDPYNQSVDAYGNYVTDETNWQKEADQLNADIAAGKYKVDPFAYLRQGGHSLSDIDELRKQINAGNTNPNMGVPTLRAAPTAVERPGDAPAAPTLQDNVADVNVDEDVAKTLGYAPSPKKSAPVLPQAKTITTDAPPPKTDVTQANPDAKPTPVTNPGSVDQSKIQKPTNQQPPATTPTIQQLPGAAPSPASAAQKQQPINAATSLPQQTSGSVAGQSSSTADAKQAQSQPTPDALANPAPFKDPDKEEDNKDKRWEL